LQGRCECIPPLGGMHSHLLVLPDQAVCIHCIGSGESSPNIWLETTAWEYMFQGTKNGVNVLTAGVVSHQADANQVTLEGTKPATDLDTILVQQTFAHRQFVHSFRQANRGQDGEFVARLRE